MTMSTSSFAAVLRNYARFLPIFALSVAASGCVAETDDLEALDDEGMQQEEVGESAEALCSPYVSYVSPTSAKLNQSKIFTVYGSCLPSTTALWIAECANLTKISWSSTQVVFTCTPSYTTGLKPGVVKDQSGGYTLKNFTVQVY
jgi:hypothetical protein